jgi:hypothetical protein
MLKDARLIKICFYILAMINLKVKLYPIVQLCYTICLCFYSCICVCMYACNCLSIYLSIYLLDNICPKETSFKMTWFTEIQVDKIYVTSLDRWSFANTFNSFCIYYVRFHVFMNTDQLMVSWSVSIWGPLWIKILFKTYVWVFYSYLFPFEYISGRGII